jgi:hypothetical protein
MKMELRETVCVGMDWVTLAHDRDQWKVHVNMAMNLCIP